MKAKFKVGDKVMFEKSPAVIVKVWNYMPTAKGKIEKIWYEVRKDGHHSTYAVSESVNHLTKINEKE